MLLHISSLTQTSGSDHRNCVAVDLNPVHQRHLEDCYKDAGGGPTQTGRRCCEGFSHVSPGGSKDRGPLGSQRGQGTLSQLCHWNPLKLLPGPSQKLFSESQLPHL